MEGSMKLVDLPEQLECLFIDVGGVVGLFGDMSLFSSLKIDLREDFGG